MNSTHLPATDRVAIARTLRDAALYLARHGWIRGALYDATATTFTPPACLAGALAIVCFSGPVEAPAWAVNEPGHEAYTAAVDYLEPYLIARYRPGDTHYSMYDFNDQFAYDGDDVIVALWDAADAIDPPDSPHDTTLPHVPGQMLHGCDACRQRCYCRIDFQCAFCTFTAGGAA